MRVFSAETGRGASPKRQFAAVLSRVQDLRSAPAFGACGVLDPACAPPHETTNSATSPGGEKCQRPIDDFSHGNRVKHALPCDPGVTPTRASLYHRLEIFELSKDSGAGDQT